MVEISKFEAFELQKLGHKFGSDGTLHHTNSRYRKYYLTETRKGLADLNTIRNSRVKEIYP